MPDARQVPIVLVGAVSVAIVWANQLPVIHVYYQIVQAAVTVAGVYAQQHSVRWPSNVVLIRIASVQSVQLVYVQVWYSSTHRIWHVNDR